jgi:hypothetical protein
MNKQIAIELKEAVDVVCDRFSRKDRQMNFNNETFSVDEIIPASDHCAIVKFKKMPTEKIGIAFFYYIPNGISKGWKYFFPTDSHIAGMKALEIIKFEVERKNYQFNFQ